MARICNKFLVTDSAELHSVPEKQVRKYGYKYDQLNRLQKAVYQKPYESTPVTNSYN